jgi:hypothetical protein
MLHQHIDKSRGAHQSRQNNKLFTIGILASQSTAAHLALHQMNGDIFTMGPRVPNKDVSIKHGPGP